MRINDTSVELGSTKQRRLLALLLMRANRPVSVNELIDAIWPENPPRTARKNLQVYVCGLRKLFPDRIEYDANGYVFTSDSAELDLHRFEELIATGRRAARNGDATASADLLGSAVRLWRGRPAAGLWEAGEIPGDAARLWDRFVSAYEDWIDATISVGLHIEALENLDSMGESIAFSERLTISRMRALSLCGRTLEALAFYEAKRQYLVREYGIDPSPVLQAMYLSLLSPESQEKPAVTANVPPPAVHAATHQLPRRLPDLVGRKEPLRQLLDGSGGIKVLWGQVGAGKTSLAVHAAHLAAARYPDGNLFVRSQTPEGRAKDEASVVRELLRAVGLAVAVPDDPEAAVALWRSWTTDRKILLVLDDVPGEDYVDAVLPSSPESLVIITSRSRLSGLEADQWIELDDFSEWEASQLLARLIGEPRVEKDQSAVAKIIACCGGSPLAIRVAGGKLSALPHLSLADFAGRLAAGDPLSELVSGQASVEARYTQWYQGLPREAKAAAHRLAELSPCSFTYAAACQALARDGHAPDRTFELLVELSVLSVSMPPSFSAVTAHSAADDAHSAAGAAHSAADDAVPPGEAYEIPPLIRRLLLRDLATPQF
ncbi:MAG TPA: BTAD domain-containing putative transcriptional regulator [Streptosporangiaceae bacterium]